jgi:hypothetical protein
MSALARQANLIQSDDPVPNEAEAREAAISRRETMNKLLSKPFQDGVGYEVRIPVKELGLKGLLEKADREEDGSREVPVRRSGRETRGYGFDSPHFLRSG